MLEGQQAGGPVPLAARLFPEPDAHCRDEGSPLAATVFGQEEGHVTFWGQFLHGLVHDSGEAEKEQHMEEEGKWRR